MPSVVPSSYGGCVGLGLMIGVLCLCVCLVLPHALFVVSRLSDCCLVIGFLPGHHVFLEYASSEAHGRGKQLGLHHAIHQTSFDIM